MKITWGKNAKTNRQPSVAPSKPGLPFGVDSDNDETEKEETRVVTTDCPGTKPSDNAESLKNQGNRLAEVSFFSFIFFYFLFFSFNNQPRYPLLSLSMLHGQTYLFT